MSERERANIPDVLNIFSLVRPNDIHFYKALFKPKPGSELLLEIESLRLWPLSMQGIWFQKSSEVALRNYPSE